MRHQPRGSVATRHRARSGACRLVALVSHHDRTELDMALRESSRLDSLLQEVVRLIHGGSRG